MKRTHLLHIVLAAVLLISSASSQASLALWSAPSMERISRTAPPRSAEVVTLAAARNEWEAVQIIVCATPAEHEHAAFTLTPFTAADGSKLPIAQLYQEAYVKVTTASPNSPLGTGEYPDALIPAADAKPTKQYFPGSYNQPWWLEQFIPANATPGLYHARILCRANDSERALELELTVWPFSLPARATLRTTFGAHWGRIAEIHHLPAYSSSTVLRDRVAQYQHLLAEHRLTPEPMYPEMNVATDGTLKAFPVEELRPFFEQLHATSFPLPICAKWPFADPLGKHRRATIKYLAEVMKAMHHQGWDKDCFVDCPVDEPQNAEAYAQVRAWGNICHEAEQQCGLHIPLLCTVAPAPKADWGTLVGAVDIWVPCVGDLFKDTLAPNSAIQQRQAEGEPIWAYTAMVNHPPEFIKQHPEHPADHHPPTWLIDYAPMNYRILAWQCAANNWQGMLYWDTIHWASDSDPWQDPGTFTEPGAVYNGDGCLVYPTASGPIASLRLKWLREAMEDHCLIQMVRAAGLTSLAETEVQAIARGITDWDANPAALLAARLRLGNALATSLSMKTSRR